MQTQPLIAMVATTESQTIDVMAPTVGWYCQPPAPGTLLHGDATVGCLKILYRKYLIKLPSDVQGYVLKLRSPDRAWKVQYGQVLFELSPVAQELDPHRPSSESRAAPDTCEHALAIKAPTEGTFYRRPQPEAPPYVEEGQIVKRGSVLGLVEVMKCFFQVTCEGPDIPSQVRIVKIQAADGSAIKAGQVLFYVQEA